jgi:hypothetical protein
MKTKKKFPSYNIDSPKYQSLLILYDNLAYQDAAFLANQIIIESFNDYIVNKGIDGKLLICQQASLHKISAGTDDLERIREMMAELYIVQTYNIAELFFKEFNKEYQAIHKIKAWKTTKRIGNSDKNLDPLNQLLNNINKSKKRTLKSFHNIYLLITIGC